MLIRLRNDPVMNELRNLSYIQGTAQFLSPYRLSDRVSADGFDAVESSSAIDVSVARIQTCLDVQNPRGNQDSALRLHFRNLTRKIGPPFSRDLLPDPRPIAEEIPPISYGSPSAKWNFRNPSPLRCPVNFIACRFIAYPGGTTSFVSVQSGAHLADGLRKPVATA